MIKNVSEYIAEYDVCVALEPMPMHIRALIKRAGEYDCIIVNDYLSAKEKRKAFEHELRHKDKNDLDSKKSVKEIEEENEF